ncbi:hypothetical protein GCK72_004865 [Caenorhabditis remanei]|uniref:BZIP domain-containing protein n=1 Tax=Caenorhabditis remanei TaxID=31234 RepID=A0A6A5HDH9_CAERE|nr:hypothetical protein GCK72_004865 [Caenorhabditis remanei]KAF1764914.1 hypothetical protein GCK72_004865 [Caenorhabditis remanei]
MQLDCRSVASRRNEKYQHQIQKNREAADRSRNSYRFERMMSNRLKSIDETLRSIESRISAEVEQRVVTAVQEIINSDLIRDVIDQRVREIIGTNTPATPAPSPSSSSSASSSTSSSNTSGTSSDSEESSSTISCASSTCAEPPTSTVAEDDTASCSGIAEPIPSVNAPHYPSKWEFVTCLNQGEVTDFRLDQFTDPVRNSLKMTSDQDIFPRMSLEEMIERDHPTTSDSSLFDEKKISCKNRPQGKTLTDEEFFCLAPCCSDMRLFQAASCPFLPAFVRNRLNKTEDCKVIVQRTANGVELITPMKWQRPKPIVPDLCDLMAGVSMEEEEAVDETEEEEDPLSNRDVVEQLMHEYFIPTPSVPLDDFVFGPYLERVRDTSETVPKNLLHDLVRRVNSNLDNSYKSHHELELFAELDKVPIDEKYGRLPFDSMGN